MKKIFRYIAAFAVIYALCFSSCSSDGSSSTDSGGLQVKPGTTGLRQKYTTSGFTVFFNAENNSYTIDSAEKVNGKVVTISDGDVKIAESETEISSIPPLSTVIIKNN